MNDKIQTESGGGAADTLKLMLATALAVGGIVGFYWFAARPMYERVGMVLAGLVLGAALALSSAPGRGFWSYVEGSRVEVRKMVWPTRQETIQTTLALIVFVVVLGIFMLLIDMLLAWGVEKLVGAGA
jgi:preprotein translocase subunit SecE